MAKKPAPEQKAPESKPAPKAALPDRSTILKSLGLRIGLPLVAGWLVAAFVNHWIAYAVVGALTVAAAGLVLWSLRRLEGSRKVADILGGADVTDKEGRKSALEKLDEMKEGGLAKTLAKSQLLAADDPEAALRELETVDLKKALPAEADQVRFQRALIHLTRAEVDLARQLVDGIDLSRHEDPKTRGAMGSVIAEAWGRSGQAKKAKETLDLFDPADPVYADVALQIFRARAFVFASLNDTKAMKAALRKLASENPQYLGVFLQKRVHPLLEKEAKQMFMQSGAAPKRKVQYQR